jgi:hypothetical protein
MTRSAEGAREYKLISRIQALTTDGPAQVMYASGLPMVGSYWAFGGDVDPWAYCTPALTITPEITGEPNKYWTVEQTFATPTGGKGPTRCQDANIEDPLLEPPKISGAFNRYDERVEFDRNGARIKSSSHEQITGLTMDGTRPTVVFEWNSPILDLAGMAALINTLNDRSMWGLTSRKIKLNGITWSRQMYGLCNYYYTKRFEFEVRYDGFDDDKILDTGFRCLKGVWVPPAGTSNAAPTWDQDDDADKDDSTHFIRVKDYLDDPNPMRVPLDGNGGRLTDPTTPVFIPGGAVEYYDESNFLAYGVPSQLG